MTIIVYGVAGEGPGQSSRAREMVRYLKEEGHILWLVTYDRGHQNLKDDFDVFETEGLCIASEDNKVSVVKKSPIGETNRVARGQLCPGTRLLQPTVNCGIRYRQGKHGD